MSCTHIERLFDPRNPEALVKDLAHCEQVLKGLKENTSEYRVLIAQLITNSKFIGIQLRKKRKEKRDGIEPVDEGEDDNQNRVIRRNQQYSGSSKEVLNIIANNLILLDPATPSNLEPAYIDMLRSAKLLLYEEEIMIALIDLSAAHSTEQKRLEFDKKQHMSSKITTKQKQNYIVPDDANSTICTMASSMASSVYKTLMKSGNRNEEEEALETLISSKTQSKIDELDALTHKQTLKNFNDKITEHRIKAKLFLRMMMNINISKFYQLLIEGIDIKYNPHAVGQMLEGTAYFVIEKAFVGKEFERIKHNIKNSMLNDNNHKQIARFLHNVAYKTTYGVGLPRPEITCSNSILSIDKYPTMAINTDITHYMFQSQTSFETQQRLHNVKDVHITLVYRLDKPHVVFDCEYISSVLEFDRYDWITRLKSCMEYLPMLTYVEVTQISPLNIKFNTYPTDDLHIYIKTAGTGVGSTFYRAPKTNYNALVLLPGVDPRRIKSDRFVVQKRKRRATPKSLLVCGQMDKNTVMINDEKLLAPPPKKRFMKEHNTHVANESTIDYLFPAPNVNHKLDEMNRVTSI